VSYSVIEFPDTTLASTERKLANMDKQIASAIEEAKSLRVPQGLIIAILHAHALRETQEILK
jgi:hypothetical protein